MHLNILFNSRNKILMINQRLRNHKGIERTKINTSLKAEMKTHASLLNFKLSGDLTQRKGTNNTIDYKHSCNKHSDNPKNTKQNPPISIQNPKVSIKHKSKHKKSRTKSYNKSDHSISNRESKKCTFYCNPKKIDDEPQMIKSKTFFMPPNGIKHRKHANNDNVFSRTINFSAMDLRTERELPKRNQMKTRKVKPVIQANLSETLNDTQFKLSTKTTNIPNSTQKISISFQDLKRLQLQHERLARDIENKSKQIEFYSREMKSKNSVLAALRS